MAKSVDVDDNLEPIDKLEQITLNLSNKNSSLEHRLKYTQQNRRSLLFIHAAMSLGIGFSIAFEGGPTAFYAVGYFNTFFLAGAPLLGGALLLTGLSWGRVIVLEAMGLAFLFAWYVFMIQLFVRAKLWVPLSSTYPVFVYTGFACFIAIHLITFCRLVKAREQ